LTATKGQALLVMACSRLVTEGHRLRCILIGAGEESESLAGLVAEHGLQEHVELTGALPQDGVREHLTRADLFVLPSFAEGVPVVLMEAMSMEIPCIGTRVGGIAELIEDGVDSWLAHSGDLDGLTERLRAALTNPAAMGEIGKRARQKIIAEFDINKSAAQFAKLFAARLKKPK
jgi:glycosyltransferase involved in cell wall biosynthesis